VFEKYRKLENKSIQALLDELGCSESALSWAYLCRRPVEGHFIEQVRAIATRCGLDAHRLAAVIRRVQVASELQESTEEGRSPGFAPLMAARDRDPEGEA
jgi:hypothetical protein